MAATFRFFDTPTAQALWFLSAGLLMVVVAALNLLNVAYGRIALGLRIVCVAANIAISAFAIAAGWLGRASLTQWIVVLGIVGPLSVLSCVWAVNKQEAS